MKETELQTAPKRHLRAARRRGSSEVLEMSLVMMPFFSLFFLQMTLAYWVFAKVTLQQAVRAGVRYGVTNTLNGCPGVGGADLTTCIQRKVQWAAGGLLSGSNINLIKVTMCHPPGSTSPVGTPCVDVTGTPGSNAGDNILQVSVESFAIAPLLPVIPSWRGSEPNTGPLTITVRSADKIEPGGAPPPGCPGC
jgi:hypothetical protein